MQLRDFQSEMSAYLTSPPGPEVPHRLLALLPSDSARDAKRFAVYKNNVYARLVDALRASFPAVERLVGEEFFRYAAVEYVSRTPALTATLLAYGESFPGFLAGFQPAKSVPYLSDVARLEYLYLESYHAPDAESLAQWSDATAREPAYVPLHPSARLMTSPYEVSRIWELNRRDAPVEDVVLPPVREYLLIVRPGREVEVRRVSLGAYSALRAIANGASVAQACREAISTEPRFDFAKHAQALARAGTFVPASTKDAAP
jgi:hypothetical protein